MEVKVIFGPPGTGKTTRLLEILEDEMEEVDVERIAYVSFTREGAYQARDRAQETFAIPKSRFKYFRTLHSLAFRELGLNRNQVISKENYKEFSNKMGMNFTGFYTDDFRHNDDRYLFFNILYRNNPRTASKYLFDMDMQKLKFVSGNYKRYKRYHGILDFTDIIERFNEANKGVSVDVAIIDEAQDLTTLQWRMVWTAFKHCQRVFIAGDDDQAIYEWSGADVDYFLGIEGDVEILHHSYRLPKNIVRFAKTITDRIAPRVEKRYQGREYSGALQKILSIEELDIDTDETWMFLSRNHVFLKEVVQHLRNRGLVYTLNGKLSMSDAKISAIIDFEKDRKEHGRLSQNTQEQLFRSLKKGWNIRDPWYDNFSWDEDEIVYYRDLIRTKNYYKDCVIRVNTIHSVKGSEADNVVVGLDITRQVGENLQSNPNSEYRVLYVGCTRARKNLYLIEQNTPHGYKIGEWL